MSGKKIPLIWGVVMIGIGVWTIFAMTSGFKYVIGPACLFAGWYSLKAAVFMTDDEINTINSGSSDEKTSKKFENL